MDRPRLATVLLPAHGAGDGLVAVVRDLAVAAYALRARGVALDVLLLDDGRARAAALAAKAATDFGLPLVTIAGPPSQGAAYVAGFRQVLDRGRADLVVTLDATGQHDATQIPHLVDQLVAEDLDVVIGSRWARASGTPGLTLRRWALGRTANLAFRWVTGIHGVTDVTTTFRIARTEVVRELDLDALPDDARSLQMAFVAAAVGNGRRVGEGAILYRPPAAALRPVGGREVVSFASQLLPLRRTRDRLRLERLRPGGRRFSDRSFGAAGDLERLGAARHFFGWALEEFEPFLGGRVLEVGAGTGTITRRLVELDPELSIVALEPAGNLFGDLASFAALTPRVAAARQTLAEYLAGGEERFDAVVYLNVLEHVADDATELRLAARALRPGGALLLFGPALEWLYSELDYNAGHYRRYSLARLHRLATEAGFEVLSLRYFDVVGVLPYLVAYRLLRRPAISGSTLWGYDRLLVPVSRRLQRAVPHPPLGKNVVMVARKAGPRPILRGTTPAVPRTPPAGR
jgi:2-polyprenyl-3-methyl-5-hydroxy-6-metoxy-1,4-benzoquinol methylase